MTIFTQANIGKQGYGAMGLSSSYGQADETESLATLARAFELGITLFDTADVYGTGHNEKLLAQAIAGRRDDLVIASKFGIVRNREGDGPQRNGSPAYARQSVEGSLQRLRIDHIDLYYLHRVDPDTPIEDTVGELARLKQEGKIGAIGLSEAPADIIRRAHHVHPIAALQSEYSLWTREVEREILPTTRELGIVFVAFSPLGRGFLAGSGPVEPDDRRHRHPRFQPDAIAANGARRAVAEQIAAGLGGTVAQVSLAWLIAKGVVPIPGTRHIRHLEANWAANEIALDATTVAALDAAFPIGSTVGDRTGGQQRAA